MTSAEAHKDRHLDRVAEIIGERLDDSSSGRVAVLARQFFRRMPVEELMRGDPEMQAAVAAEFLSFMRQRAPGEIRLRIFNPDAQDHGWETSHTVVEIVNDDMPFLVDSVVLALSELGITAHLIIHPVIRVVRDREGCLLGLADDEQEDAKSESLIHLLIDRQTDPDSLARIEKRIYAALNDVRRSVEDWRPMRQKAQEIAGELAETGSELDEAWLEEARDFFEWLANDHFTFLGYREYLIRNTRGGRMLEAVPGSGLGIMRESYRKAPARPLKSLSGGKLSREYRHDPIIITKTNGRSTVHRSGYMDYISVLRFDRGGRVAGEKRIIGLFTSGAYIRRCQDTPLVRRKVQEVVQQSGLRPGSHAGKALLHILETLPRDELFQATSSDLLDMAMGILDLQERSQTRLFIRRERFGRFYSCLVFIPRDRFNTENREKIQAILKRKLKGDRLDFAVQVGESKLARMHVVVRPKSGQTAEYDIQDIEGRIKQAIRSWEDELGDILIQEHGEEEGLNLLRRIGRAFPMSYMEDVSPRVASFDVVNASLLSAEDDLRMSLYKPRKRVQGILRFKIFKFDEPILLSDVLPMLEHLGMRIVSERPYELSMKEGKRIWIQDFDMLPPAGKALKLDQVRDQFQSAFANTWRRRVENDGFNRLVLLARLDWRQVTLIRACCKYLLQTGMPYSQAYMEQTLSAWPLIARLLVEYFESRFDPARREENRQQKANARKALETKIGELAADITDSVLAEFLDEACAARENDREGTGRPVRKAILRALENVSSADQDRILRAFTDVIAAMLRTNFFKPDDDGEAREYLSFKFDSALVPDLPRPRPLREIWVYSPRMEGIHLRCGKVARGGLRWSDRREDFRTEILGLMKAQNVKNTMIVPVGAKGGFVVKQPPGGDDRERLMEEVKYCYRCFIHGMLDITDNLDGDEIQPPAGVIRHDDDDPYLVVAADKGTATFSDIANEIAAEHGFWLEDAFASGGSNGYDHKKMGVTAKGAWESVKRHFRELGQDIQNEDFTVVGIGDMSGDVFGNGMLMSKHIRLKAAFNHVHIFLDPDPDPETGYAERERLFSQERSTWSDYDKKLISRGGGVFSRQAKTIELSPQVREWLGVEDDSMAPHALIRELLKAPVDLLWNGGIGTYVKSAPESNADVGDLANNPVRINGGELRCKVVGEGGNLGFTQRGRIEYALHGGRINTDFIDNSAGVDCSDHEVNIKILLNKAVESGELDLKKRNRMLREMTAEVEELVLRSNYLQTQAISMMESLTSARLGAETHFIAMLEHQGVIDRDLENLPDEEALRERVARGRGLTRPELALLLSYSKIIQCQELIASDVPEDPYLSRELEDYFPRPLSRKFKKFMPEHRLWREIIAMRVTNSIVNRMGAHFAMRIKDDTGASPATVAKAYTVAREIFDARAYWKEVELLDNRVPAQLQTRAFLEMWNLLRQMTRRLITLPGGFAIDISSKVNRFAPGVREYRKCLADALGQEQRGELDHRAGEFIRGGFPKGLASQVASLAWMYSALDIIDEARSTDLPVKQVTGIYFRLLDRLCLKWLREQVESLPVEKQWHAHARGNLRDDLYTQHRLLTRRVLSETITDSDPVDSWFKRHREDTRQVEILLEEMRTSTTADFATLQVAIHGLRQLLHASV